LIDGEKSEFGIESTVIKLNVNNIEILRFGSISKKQLREALSESVKYKDIEIIKGSK
jgi:tRNA A37 threonylcarbamoyladenosine synthetase subunit TsaC/SUA5/YrdC